MLEGKARRNVAAALVAVLFVGGLCLLILDAADAKPSPAPSAHAAAVKTIDVSVTSDGSDAGYYVWEDQFLKDPTDPTYYDLVVRSGSARIFWTWPAGGGSSHNVKMKTGLNYATNRPYSTPGLSFFNGKGSGSPFTNDSGVDYVWPTKENGGVDGWVPGKAGTYYLFCSQHSAMFMKVIVKSLIGKVWAKQRTVRSGTKSIFGTAAVDVPTRASIRVALCANRSCSRTRTVASRTLSLNKGRNGLRVGTKGLKAGRYQLQAVAGGNVTAGLFTVR